MEIKGKVTQVLNPITGTSAKGDWKKQTYVIETPGEYPKSIAFDVFNDKIRELSIGEDVSVEINIDSREYQGKWFTNVVAWKINEGQQAPQEQQEPAPIGEKHDTLPF